MRRSTLLVGLTLALCINVKRQTPTPTPAPTPSPPLRGGRHAHPFYWAGFALVGGGA